MTNDDKIRDQKLQNDIKREAAKSKVDKYEYLPGADILPPDQKIMIDQAKFTYSLLG